MKEIRIGELVGESLSKTFRRDGTPSQRIMDGARDLNKGIRYDTLITKSVEPFYGTLPEVVV